MGRSQRGDWRNRVQLCDFDPLDRFEAQCLCCRHQRAFRNTAELVTIVRDALGAEQYNQGRIYLDEIQTAMRCMKCGARDAELDQVFAHQMSDWQAGMP